MISSRTKPGSAATFLATITPSIAAPTSAGYMSVIVLLSAVATIMPAICHLYGPAKRSKRHMLWLEGLTRSCRSDRAHFGEIVLGLGSILRPAASFSLQESGCSLFVCMYTGKER